MWLQMKVKKSFRTTAYTIFPSLGSLMRSGAVQKPLTWEDDNIHVPVRDWVPLVHALIPFEIYSITD